MDQVVVTKSFWVAAFFGESALIGILLRKGRWREFPAFTALIASNICAFIVLFGAKRSPLPGWYAPAYWTYALVNVLIQVAVVFEIALIVLRPTGTWVRDARKQFLSFGIGGAAIAFALAWFVVPPAPNWLDVVELRANLFTSLLTCELVIAVSLASNRLGLGWRNHVMSIGQGLMTWSIVAVVIDSINSYYGTAPISIHSYFGTVFLSVITDDFKGVFYLGLLAYWCVQLWREEPARQPISPQLRKFILALHDRVQYDLGEAEQ